MGNSYKYKRDNISGWLLTALENAGRDDELLRVYETEARATASYERLVKYLIAERKYEEAERWAREGIEQTCEKLPDDVLHWYDKMQAADKRSAGPWGRRALHGGSTADHVAAAVAKSHPERALEIYRQGLDSHLPHANISSYESAAQYLKAMRPIMKSLKQAEQWDALVVEIRDKYRNRPRFMEILDRLEGRTILADRRPAAANVPDATMTTPRPVIRRLTQCDVTPEDLWCRNK